MRQLWNPRYTLGLHSEDMSLALKPTHATVKAYYDTLRPIRPITYRPRNGQSEARFRILLAKSGRKSEAAADASA